ncbi:Retrovirus-related Pol polyprotein from transposon TNT 1-94 [Sesbania bispinosa]|nr:Retrovirus-related Pol polyprotein from transposon TNT 1-94 [Sesbania bispinosa]
MVNSTAFTQSSEASCSKPPEKQQVDTKNILTNEQYGQLMELLRKSNSDGENHAIGQL